MPNHYQENNLKIKNWTASMVGAGIGYALTSFCNENESNATSLLFKCCYFCFTLGFFWAPCFKQQPLSTISGTLFGITSTKMYMNGADTFSDKAGELNTYNHSNHSSTI
jgi:hypothetical protein